MHLTLAAAESDSVLRYTLDSSEPTEDSPLFTAPIEIASRVGQTNVLSTISGTATANQHTDGWRPPLGEVRKATVVRARAFRPGALPGPVATRTYFIGPAGVRIEGLPTLSIVSPTDGLFDYYRGIYMLGAVFDRYVASHPGEPLTGHTPANYTQRGSAWERAADVEFFDPDVMLAWREPVALGIQGKASRSFRQRSFGLKARGVTGKENTIEVAIFPGLARLGDGTPLTEFRHLRLRNTGNDWDVAVILYGEGGLIEGRAGDDQVFRALRNYATTHDLSVLSNYSYLDARLDMDNFILYQLSEICFASADWPQNNMRVWRRRLGAPNLTQPRGLDGRWRWLLFDVDLGVGHPWSTGYTEDTLAIALSPTGRPGFDTASATAFLRALIRNPDFEREFLNTAADLLNSWFLPARAVGLVGAMEAELRAAMEEHLRRWRSCGGSVSAWRQRVQVMRTFAQNRAGQMRQHCVKALARAGTTQLTLNVADPASGRLRVNRLIVDTNLPGVGTNPYPWRGTYFRDAPVTLEAIPAPGYRFAGWTGRAATNRIATVTLTNALAITASFVPAPQDWTALVLTELHYHPPATSGPDDDPVEFVELRNTGGVALDLTGLDFSQGIGFAFSNRTTLAPGAFLVLAESRSGFAARFPGVEVHGEYAGQLNNAGETLALGYSGGSPVLALAYGDAPPWPARADGGGSSLQRVNLLADASDAGNWCAAPPTPAAETPADYRDSDADGLPDRWELAHEVDPADPADADQDADLDGMTNRLEFWAETDPRALSSALRFDQVERGQDPATVVLSFVVRSNVSCRVQAHGEPGGGESGPRSRSCRPQPPTGAFRSPTASRRPPGSIGSSCRDRDEVVEAVGALGLGSEQSH